MKNDELAAEIERRCAGLAGLIAEAEKKGTRRGIAEAEMASQIGSVVFGNLPAILTALRTPAAAVDAALRVAVRESGRAALAAMPAAGVADRPDALRLAVKLIHDCQGILAKHVSPLPPFPASVAISHLLSRLDGPQWREVEAALRSAPPPAAESRAGEVERRLIATAPDLLHECRREVDWLRHILPQIKAPDSVMLGFQQALKYLGAAIAKAEGSTAQDPAAGSQTNSNTGD